MTQVFSNFINLHIETIKPCTCYLSAFLSSRLSHLSLYVSPLSPPYLSVRLSVSPPYLCLRLSVFPSSVSLLYLFISPLSLSLLSICLSLLSSCLYRVLFLLSYIFLSIPRKEELMNYTQRYSYL